MLLLPCLLTTFFNVQCVFVLMHVQCKCVCVLYAHVSVQQVPVERFTSGMFLNHLLSSILRRGLLLNLGITDLIERFASLSPQHWDVQRMPSHRTFYVGTGAYQLSHHSSPVPRSFIEACKLFNQQRSQQCYTQVTHMSPPP